MLRQRSQPASPVLDPAKVAGKIVALRPRHQRARGQEPCGRGGRRRRHDPAQHDRQLAQRSTSTSCRPCTCAHTDGSAIKAYAAHAPARRRRSTQATVVFNAPAPFTAAFSSRGPLLAGGGDLLKPDVIGAGPGHPGGVFAPSDNAGRTSTCISGTSMSSPHVAGLAALMKELHPNWSPMAIKSALMTTGERRPRRHREHQSAGDLPPGRGPRAAEQGGRSGPGLRLELQRLARLPVRHDSCRSAPRPAARCGLGFRSIRATSTSPSIAIGDLAGTQTVKRRVTNVGSSAATYTRERHGHGWVHVTVTPSHAHAGPGPDRAFDVTFTRTTAPLNAYTRRSAHLDRRRRAHGAHPDGRAAGRACGARAGRGHGRSDLLQRQVRLRRAPSPRRLAGSCAAVTTTGTVADDPTERRLQPDARRTRIEHRSPSRPARPTRASRCSTTRRRRDDDLDLCVFDAARRWSAAAAAGDVDRGRSTSSTRRPAPTPWSSRGFATDGPDANFTLFTLAAGQHGGGQHDRHRACGGGHGRTGTIDLSFSGLTAGTKYLGSVAYAGAPGLPNPTIVRVDP